MSETQSNRPKASSSLPRPKPPRWISRAVLAVVFVSGGLIGASLTVLLRPDKAWRGRTSPEDRRDRIVDMIADEVDLSADQVERVRQVVAERLADAQEIRKVVEPQMRRQATLLYEEVNALLNDEQKPRWKTLYEDLSPKGFPEPPASQPAAQEAKTTD